MKVYVVMKTVYYQGCFENRLVDVVFTTQKAAEDYVNKYDNGVWNDTVYDWEVHDVEEGVVE